MNKESNKKNFKTNRTKIVFLKKRENTYKTNETGKILAFGLIKKKTA